jgi:hypothetical protein
MNGIFSIKQRMGAYSLLGLALSGAVFAHEQSSSDGPDRMRHARTPKGIKVFEPQLDLSNIPLQIMKYHQEKKIPYSKMLVVLDVEGTITNQPNPKGVGETDARGGAVELINILKNLDVKVIASSSSKDFNQTVGQIEHLNLSKSFELTNKKKSREHEVYFDGDSHKISSQKPKKRKAKESDVEKVKVERNGNVAAVTTEGNSSQHQAIAPYIIYPAKKLDKKTKAVFFADDSQTNIQSFIEDVEQYHLYRKAKYIDIFPLYPRDVMKEKTDQALMRPWTKPKVQPIYIPNVTLLNREKEKTSRYHYNRVNPGRFAPSPIMSKIKEAEANLRLSKYPS